MTGLFITFEGPDGAGKTSVIRGLMTYFSTQVTRPIVLTREPGGIPIAEEIREVILNPQNTAMDKRTEALLYAAARRQHLVEKIRPALAADKIVFCDRFVDSSLVYQGLGREIGVEAVQQLNLFATEGLEPALTLYLDVPAEVGLARIQTGRQGDIDRLDAEKLPFHQRVRAGYLELLAAYPERIKKIDATQDLAAVIQEAIGVIEAQLQKTFAN